MKINNTFIFWGIFLLSSLLFLSSCDDFIVGNGNIVEETREVKPFKAIDISGVFKVFLTQGDEESLVIEADDNLMQYIESYVSGGTLYLGTKGFGIRSATIRAYITMKELREIEASGAVTITGETPFDFSRLTIQVSGAANIDMEMYGEKLELNVSGAGKGYLKGEVDRVFIDLSGASKLDAEQLYANTMAIEISGAGSANVNVEEELDASISGAGHVRYAGNPNVRSNVSGAGKVSKMK